MLNPIEFGYTGKTQKITLYPDKAGIETFNTPFLIECWGAQGSSGSGGNYTKGILSIMVPTDLYINVGGAGGYGANAYGWYSDGQGYYSINGTYGYNCSGGASDVSFDGIENDTNWNTARHLNNILLRAKGGNGGTHSWNETITNYANASSSYNATSNTAATTITNTHAQGTATSVSGGSGGSSATCLIIKPNKSGTLIFYSYSNSGDPYGHVYTRAGRVAYNDDGNGNRNFYVRLSVTAGYTYYLRPGSWSGSSSYSWYASYPDSQASRSDISGYYATTVTRSASGGICNYGDFFNPLLVQTGSTAATRSGNGLVRIRQYSIEPHNSDFRYDPAPQVAYDYNHFMKVIKEIKGT